MWRFVTSTTDMEHQHFEFGSEYFAYPFQLHFRLPPEHHIEMDVPSRPWEQRRALAASEAAHKHKQCHWNNKFFQVNYAPFKPQDPKDWIIFPGDLVQVMIGKDKGKQGIVSHVIREYNAVFVDGLHMVCIF
jgi:large subunit ribosomal protein L24